MAKLTAKEKKWVSDVQRVLDKCPSKRIGFYTIGDNDVSLYDRNFEDKISNLQTKKGRDFGPVVDDLDAGFDEQLWFPSPVESTAG